MISSRFILSLIFVSLVSATTYTVSGVTFDDGASGSGTFDFDGSSCTNIDISTTAGSTLSAATYTSDCIPLGSERILFPLRDPNNNNIITRYLSFQFDSSLGGFTGTYPIDTTSNGNSYECMNCSPVRYITAGTVTAGVVTTQQFCAAQDQSTWFYGSGYYCTQGGAAFIQCYGEEPYTNGAVLGCPAGTSCQCDAGVECTNGGTQSPCTTTP